MASKIWKALYVDNSFYYIFESYDDKIGWKNYLSVYPDSEDSLYCNTTNEIYNWSENNNYILSEPSKQELEHYLACVKAGEYVEAPKFTEKWNKDNIIGLKFKTDISDTIYTVVKSRNVGGFGIIWNESNSTKTEQYYDSKDYTIEFFKNRIENREWILEESKSLSREELLEEAKRRFPVGTKFKQISNEKIYEAETTPHFYYHGENYIAVRDLHGVVYKDGVWAEVISLPEPKKLKKEDFVKKKIWIGDNRELSVKIQEILLNLGFIWYGGKRNEVKWTNYDNICLDSGYMIFSQANESCYKQSPYKEIFPKDLGIEENNWNSTMSSVLTKEGNVILIEEYVEPTSSEITIKKVVKQNSNVKIRISPIESLDLRIKKKEPQKVKRVVISNLSITI